MESQVLDLINKARTDAGIAAITRDASLDATADVRSSEIAVKFDHDRPNGGNCFDAFPSGCSAMGENIAEGQTAAEEVMADWMNSEGHRANILNASFTKVGISCYLKGSTY